MELDVEKYFYRISHSLMMSNIIFSQQIKKGLWKFLILGWFA
ncbi:hypothetical protein [Trichodesmium erythraeum]